MFRKGAPLSLFLSAICSAFFTYLIWNNVTSKSIETLCLLLIPFPGYLLGFSIVFLGIYDIIHKNNVKYSRAMLGGGISIIVALTSIILNALTSSSICLTIIFIIALLSFGIFMANAIRHEKKKSP